MYIRVAEPDGQDAITRAVQKLAVEKDAELGAREWFVSAPGKVILFGEHAVVHGVVSDLNSALLTTSTQTYPFYLRLLLQRQSTSDATALLLPVVIIGFQYTSMTSNIFLASGTPQVFLGTR